MQDKNTIINKYLPNLPYLNQERSQKFFGIALTLVALSFFGFFAISPTVSAILKLQKEVSDSQFVVDQLGTKMKNLSELGKQYANLQNDLPIIASAMPAQPNAHLLFAQIQTLAQESHIKMKKLQNFEVEILRSNKGPGKDYYSYSFSISGSGTFTDIYNFVSSVANMQRIVSIDVFSVNKMSEKNVQSLEFDIQGTAFFKE